MAQLILCVTSPRVALCQKRYSQHIMEINNPLVMEILVIVFTPSLLQLFVHKSNVVSVLNPLNPELNPICFLMALLAHHFLHVSRIRVKLLTLRLLMSYIYTYMEHLFLMFLDHTQRRTTVGRTPLDE